MAEKNEIHVFGITCVYVKHYSDGWNEDFCDNGDELSCL